LLVQHLHRDGPCFLGQPRSGNESAAVSELNRQLEGEQMIKAVRQMLIRNGKSWFLFGFFVLVLLGIFFSLVFLQDKVIGAAGHPGLQGEILFEKNIIYNFENGDLFRYFKTDYLNYPFGENLGFALVNSLHLFMYLPLKYFFSLTQAYNLLIFIVCLLNFAAAYWLARYLFNFRAAAFCSAAVFALNPYVLLKINQGFINKTVLAWIPLYLLALFKLHNTGKRVYILWAGILLCLMQLTYPPYSLYALIFTLGLGVYYLFKPGQRFTAAARFCALVFFFLLCSTLIYYFLGLGWVYGHSAKPIFQAVPDGALDLFNPFYFFLTAPPATRFICRWGYLCSVLPWAWPLL
jgi:hypothetical protein